MIVTLWKWVQGMNLPLRVLVYACTAFIAGPGFLGFISEYATYVYAMRVGVRPPVEGIPYLSATVTIASVAIALSVSLVFYATLAVVRYLAGLGDLSRRFALAYRKGVSAEISKKRNAATAFAATAFLAISVILYIFFRYIMNSDHAPPTWLLYLTCWYVISAALGFTAAIDRRFAWGSAAVLAALFYIGTLSAMFSRDYYSAFLRTIGFGGGIYVAVGLKDRSDQLQMILDVRSSEWLIGRSPTAAGHVEIPVENVLSIRYVGTAIAH